MVSLFESSPSVLNKIQLFTAICSVIGFFLLPFSWLTVLTAVFFFYLYSLVGITITLHRYYTHKSFQLSTPIHWLFTIIALLAGRGSVLGWVYVHRVHHAYADTEKDPHAPKYMGFRLFGFKPRDEEKPNLFLIKDLMNREHLFINKWYVLILLSWMCVLLMLNPMLVYFTWILPVFCVQFSQNCLNYFAHTSGHRNFDTKDESTNSIYLWPFVWGDAWHNNHHAKPKDITTKVRWWEFDPAALIIRLVRKNVHR